MSDVPPQPAESDAGFVLLGPARPALPVLVSVPHAGRDYPAALLAAARLPRARIETIEDRHADRLIAGAVAAGARAIVATRARAWIDLNRSERELDPAMIEPSPPPVHLGRSAKVDGGLGLLPRRIGGAEIWRGRVPAAELARRVTLLHRPYHAAIAAELAAIRADHGFAVLIDCHSMPPLPGGRGAARVVIGDHHGRAMASRLVGRAYAVLMAAGLRPALNAPYSGGYTLERHGAPARGIHALQLEFDRALYLDAALREPGAGLGAIVELLAGIARALADEALSHHAPLAAE